MNKNDILNETMNLAKKINNCLNHKNSTEFYLEIEECVNEFDKYKFIEKISYICSRKYIEVSKTIGLFLTYDEDLQKDIMYTFLLNSKINEGTKKEQFEMKKSQN